MAAAILALLTNTAVLAAAIVVVIVLNAGFAFWQEQQAERAVEALADYLPQRASVLRDGRRLEPFVVWGIDEIWRAIERGFARRRQRRSQRTL